MIEHKFGEVITGTQHPDAIHIAVCPVIAAEKLSPGAHIKFVNVLNAGPNCHVASAKSKTIGVVDPYLTEDVKPGQTFWMFLYPNTITGLRHSWTHPAFSTELKVVETPVTSKISPHEIWLRGYAESNGLSFDALLTAAENYLAHGDYISDGGRWEGEYVGEDFWAHYGHYTGNFVREEDQGSFFSCSC